MSYCSSFRSNYLKLLFVISLIVLPQLTFGGVYWEVAEPLKDGKVWGYFPDAISACGAGKKLKESFHADDSRFAWRDAPGQPYYTGGSYVWANMGLSPTDPGFDQSATELTCNHEYSCSGCGGWAPTGWATYWPYSGATVRIRYDEQCRPPLRWDPELLRCALPHQENAGLCTGNNEGGTGSCKSDARLAGDPIHLGTGNMSMAQSDYKGARLSFKRIYNSLHSFYGPLGNNWRHNYSSYILRLDDTHREIHRNDGKIFQYSFDGVNWNSNDYGATLTSSGAQWIYTTKNNGKEYYDSQGFLVSIVEPDGSTVALTYGSNREIDTITDDLGNQIVFQYDGDSKITAILLPGNRTIKYAYDSNRRLEQIIYPDSTPYTESDNPHTTYHYENLSYPNALTGITDQRGVRYLTWQYDDMGRAISSTQPNNVKRVDISYDADPIRNAIVTNSRNYDTNYQLETINNYYLVGSISGPGCATCGQGNTVYEHDPNNARVTRKTENGLVTEYGGHDELGNPGYKIVAVGTPEERRVDYTYDPRYRNKVATITESSVYPGHQKITTYAYDDYGHRISTTTNGYRPDLAGGYAPVTETVTYTYNGPLNQLSEINGPRNDSLVNDIITINYYPNDAVEEFNRGNIKQIIGPEGIVLRNNILYTATGKIASEERPNGVLLTYSYELGTDRLETLTETGGPLARTTRWTYLATGEVESITVALGSALEQKINLVYDDARRLTGIIDSLGNKVEYILDTEGNLVQQNVKDKEGVLYRTLQQTFDAYSRLDTRTLVDETVDYTFSPAGTLDNQTDGKNVVSNYGYDSLRRLTSVTGDAGGTDSNTQDTLTQYFYDNADRLTQVIAPNNATTNYVYDDFGYLLKESSLDRGDRIYTYDEAGNVTSITDARGIRVDYTYDGLNRVTVIDYPGTAEDVTLTYDTCANGIGQLCQIIDQSGVANNVYSPFGNLVDQVKTELGVAYTTHYDYDLLNRITKVVSPSGREIEFQYNVLGQTTAINAQVNGVNSTIVHNALYRADGLLSGLEFGNGFFEQRLYNLKGQLTSVSIPSPFIAVTQLTANAGSDQYVLENQLTHLNGTNSSDPSGVVTSYSWAQVSGPIVTLSDSAVANPSFTTPVVPAKTDIEFQLTVTNAASDVAQDNVIIHIEDLNQAPVANAGGDFSVNEKQVVQLDASGSSDPDGTIVSYYWEQIGGPAMPVSDPSLVAPTITIPNITENTDYTYKLTVTDNHGATTEDILVVTGLNLELPFPNITNGQLTVNTILDPDVTYQLSENIIVPAGLNLTISEGVVLQAAGTSQLIISGGLQVNGTVDNPVIFTSGEPNPVPGTWGGIKLLNGASPVSINYARVEFATYGVWFEDTGGTLSNSTIVNNSTGVRSSGAFSDPLISSNQIENNTTGVYVSSRGIPLVTGNTIIHNTSYGVHAFGSDGWYGYDPQPEVTNNEIYQNGVYNYYSSKFSNGYRRTLNARNNYWGSDDPIYIESTIFDYTDDNTRPTLVDYSQYLDSSRQPVTTALYGIPVNTTLTANTDYTVIGSMLVPDGVTLTIPEGVTFKFTGNYHLRVWGALAVNGTSTNKVLFTSANNTPAPGNWKGVETASGFGTLSVNNAIIEYANNGLSFLHATGTLQNSELRYNQNGLYIHMLNARPNILNNYIHNNNYYGIHIFYGAKPNITGNEITNNNIGIYSHDNSQTGYESLPTVTNNKIYNNTTWNYQAADYGYRNSAIVNARGNYWGSTDSVQIASLIYDAADNTNSAYVDYTDFLDENLQSVGTNQLYVVGSNQTLAANSVYQVIGPVRVQSGVTLTIQEGVRIEVPANYSIDVTGSIAVNGTQANPVHFTSLQTTPQPGDWAGITVNTSSGNISINHALIEYANFGVYFNAHSGTVTNSEIRSNNTGIYVYGRNANPSINGNNIHDNVNNGIYSREGANPVATGNDITANDVGILARGYQYNTGIIANDNNIYNNTSWNYQANESNSAIRNNWTLDASNNWWGSTDANTIKATINDGLDNSNYPYVDYAGFLDAPNGNPVANHLIGIYPTTVLDPNTVYHVVQNVYVPSNYTLSIPEGAIIKFDGNYRINAYGRITATGVDGNPVVFTSGSATPAASNWYGVVINGGGNGSSFNFVLSEYSAYGLYFNGTNGQVTNSELRYSTNGMLVYNIGSSVTITQNYVHDNTNAGILAGGGSPAYITSNEISNNDKGILAYGCCSSSSFDPVIVVNGNNIHSNNYNYYTQAYITTSRLLDATSNWWGTTDTAQIAQGIFDINDGGSKPTVDFGGYLTSPAVTVGFNLPPIANAGTDQNVNEGSNVTLDASASYDVNGGSITSYSWAQIAGPAVVLSDGVAVSPNFTAPLVAASTTLTFELTVTDDGGLTSTDIVDVNIQNLVIPPTADAGVDQSVNENTLVSLTGSGSDADGSIMSYAWIQTAGPAVTISNANSATANFTAPSVTGDTNLTFELTVVDNDGAIGTDSINVIVQNVNVPPTANAGVDQTVNENTLVTLNGSGLDSDGTITSYAWTQIAGPVVTITNANSASASFIAMNVNADTLLTFQLTVTDNNGAAVSDNVNITVQNVVIAPTANAGTDQTVNEGDSVNLSGSGTDSDGTITAYAWTQTSGTPVTLNSSNTATPGFTAPLVTADEVLTFQLVVTDNDGANGVDTVNVTVQNVNQLPTANAGVDQSVNEGEVVNVTGSGTDTDGTISSYSWTQTAGQAVTLTGANTANVTFTAPSVTADTSITLELTVTDNDGGVATDSMIVTVNNVNVLPTANAGSDQNVNEGDVVNLSGSGSDTDGSISTYSWVQLTGTVVTLIDATTANASFTAPTVTADETLVFELTVTDNDGATATDTVNIVVANVNQLPTSNAGVDQNVNEGDIVNVAGSGSDPDGTITTYSWVQIAGPAVSLTGANTANASFTAPSVTADTPITLELTVTDNDTATATDTVTITVINVNQLPVADAGLDQTVTEGDAVNLTGAGTDSDGTVDFYAWAQISGTPVTLTGASTANASFTAPLVSVDEVLVFELTVTDNDGSTATDTVAITVQNQNELPIANAGIDLTVTDGDIVTLDGSGSYDNDGTIVSYSWVQTAGPIVSMNNPGGSATDFTAPAVSSDTTLSFELMVTDDRGDSATDSVNVLVQPVIPPASVDNYYILNSRINQRIITVVSLVDGNTITAGNTTLNLDRYQSGTIPAADLAQGTKISGTGPFDIGSTVNTTDMPVPETFAGTEFVVPHYRNGHTYFLLSPNSDANVDIAINGVVSSIVISQGVVTEFDAGSTNSIAGVITSDQPILVSHMSGTNRDAFAVPPATVEVVGFRTSNYAIGAAQDNTSITVYASDGRSTSITLNKGEYTRNVIGSNGNEGTGDAIHVVADKPVAAIQVGDSDGNEATAFWSPAQFATRFALPVDTQYVAVTCLDSSVDVTLTDGTNPPETQPCSSDGLTPGKAYFGSTSDGVNINAGATIESTAPIYLIYEESSNSDEHNLLGNVSEQTTPMVLNTLPAKDTARTMLARESSKSEAGGSKLAVVAMPSSNGKVQYRVWRKGPETNNQWIATAEDPNAYDRPKNVLYLSEESINIWNGVSGQSKLVEQQAIDGETLIAKIQAQLIARAITDAGEFIRVNHGGTAPTGDTINSESWAYAYDANGNVDGITTYSGIKDYNYDALNRVTSDIVTGDPARSYTYDRNGNRTADSEGAANNIYSYIANSNQLDTDPMGNVEHDPAGNRISDRNGSRTFTYNNAGRLYQVFEGALLVATYTYNAQGQRTRKATQSGTVVYHYDLFGNQLSETDETGALLRDYVYMNSVPVAQIDNNAGTDVLTYIHTDHLGTPRRATNTAGDVVWSWDSDAFGTTVANEDPDNDSTATIINLRFAGQYYDTETALHYNYFRYYDPSTGRYVTSDPIGLAGGSNTYGYVGGNPNASIDPLGLYCNSLAVGTTFCGVPGGPSISFTTPNGFPQILDKYSGSLGDFYSYHYYDVTRDLDGADPECVMNELKNNPTPDPESNPASIFGTLNNARVDQFPFTGMDNFVLSYVTRDLNNGNTVVVNTAGSGDGSLFGPGYVARYIQNGVVHTAGEGMDPAQSGWFTTPFIQNWGNENVWGSQMDKIIKKCTCGK